MDRQTNTWFVMMLLSWAVLVIPIVAHAEDDPCLHYDVIENEEKRSSNYTTDLDNDLVISDSVLTEGWYRVISKSGTEMPTEAPDPYQCCTEYPIWLNGVMPSVNDGEVTQEVCMRTYVSTCEQKWNIRIKNCTSGYYVYYLTSSKKAESAYCFGDGGVQCPEGESSSTGFYPDCTSTGFPKEEVTPVVYSTLKVNPQDGTSLFVVFQCLFSDIADKNYAYDIYWYINDHYVMEHNDVLYSQIKSTDLVPENWVGKHYMNMIVRCSVRLRTTIGSLPGPFQNSDWFKAGLYPDKYQYQVLEGETITISYTSKVPVGCFDLKKQSHCEHLLYITQPKYQNEPAKCSVSNTIVQEDVAFEGYQFCGLRVPSLSYNEPIQLNVTGYIDGMYNGDKKKTTKIRLTSLPSVIDTTGVWDNITVPDIEILISDAQQQMKSRHFRSYNDPHFWTADGKYYDFYGVGEYILYRNTRYPYAVHALFTTCWSASCHCGIAIRSGESLLVIRTCKEISKKKTFRGFSSPYIDKRICDSKSLIIKEDRGTYTVTFPIGTEVKFRVRATLIDYINIKPSVLDLESTEGLCGYISKENGKTDDDFMPRNETEAVSDSQYFAKSWSVTGTNESLFLEDPPVLRRTEYLHTYCTCSKTGSPTGSLSGFNALNCNLTQPMELCNTYESDFSVSSKCSTGVSQKRKLSDNPNGHKIVRRSLDDSDDVVDFSPLTIDDDVFDESITPEEPVWRNGWTYENSEEVCKEEFSKDFLTEISEASGVNASDYIKSCIEDIKVSGDTSYLEVTLSTMKTVAMTELLLNETLVDETATNGTDTLLQVLTSQLCKKNCSGNGICNSGSCICDSQYGGDDCSQLKSIPPRNITVPDDGLCQKRQRACQKTNVYAIFSSTDVWCKISHFLVLENQTSYTSVDVVIRATYINAFQVTCPFARARRKRAAEKQSLQEQDVKELADGYEISTSNDGINFGDTVTIIVYDEECYTCDPLTKTCTFLDTCPELEEGKGNGDHTDEHTGKNTGLMVGIAAGSIVAAILFIVIIYKVYKVYKAKCGPIIVPNVSQNTLEADHSQGNIFNSVKVPYDPQKSSFNRRSLNNGADVPERSHSSASFTFELAEEGRKTPDHLFLVDRCYSIEED